MRYVEIKDTMSEIPVSPVSKEELISACMLAYWALTDGLTDVPAQYRSSKCAYIRVLAKRKLRGILDRLEEEMKKNET